MGKKQNKNPFFTATSRYSPISELQKASCGCVRAHEQPSVSWLTCRLLRTTSRLIRCWYTEFISPDFSPLFPPAQINCTESERVWRAGAFFFFFLNSAARNVPALWMWLWLWMSAADASCARSCAHGYIASRGRRGVHAPLHLCSMREGWPISGALMPSGITDAMTYWNIYCV